jgi:hypothetical protein
MLQHSGSTTLLHAAKRLLNALTCSDVKLVCSPWSVLLLLLLLLLLLPAMPCTTGASAAPAALAGSASFSKGAAGACPMHKLPQQVAGASGALLRAARSTSGFF